jgi:hypothetical protein
MNAPASKTQDLLEVLLPHITELIGSAPEYGSCGIDVVFHAGRIVRVEKRTGISLQQPVEPRLKAKGIAL